MIDQEIHLRGTNYAVDDACSLNHASEGQKSTFDHSKYCDLSKDDIIRFLKILSGAERARSKKDSSENILLKAKRIEGARTEYREALKVLSWIFEDARSVERNFIQLHETLRRLERISNLDGLRKDIIARVGSEISDHFVDSFESFASDRCEVIRKGPVSSLPDFYEFLDSTSNELFEKNWSEFSERKFDFFPTEEEIERSVISDI